MKRVLKVSLLCATLMFMLGAANADTLIATNLRAGAVLNASGGSFTGSITFTNTGNVDQGLIAFSLMLLDGSGVISNLNITGLPSGWHYYDGKQSNNGSPCNETNNENWFCADGFSSGGALPFTMADIPHNGSITFDFSGDYTGTPDLDGALDLMANGCSTIGFTTSTSNQGANTVNCDAAKWAYSADIGGPPPPPPPAAEPASLALMGAGMMTLAGALRRRFKA